MKIGQRLEYACRVAIQLALCHSGGQVSRVEDLANKEAVSPNFLVQILNDLRRAGIAISKRGKMGGYALAKSPSDITLADIIRAIEGEVLGLESDRKGASGQRVVEIWSDVASDLERRLRSVTLQEMMSGGELLEYHI